MKILLIFSLSMLLYSAECQRSSDSLLTVLKAEILKKDSYDREKELQLRKLKSLLAITPASNVSSRYIVLDNLIDGYKYYNFDSAHVYTYKLIGVSNLLRDRQKLAESKIKLGALQLSWGMYKEAFDCISQLNAKSLPDSSRLRYYELKARALNELAAYNTNRFYSPGNKTESIKTLDSAVQLSKPGTYDRYKNTEQLYSITGQKDKAIAVLRQLLGKNNLTIHQRAMVSNDLSYLVNSKEKEKLLKIAAICDIRSSTKQTQAIFRLGSRLLKRGELDDAELLLNEAVDEARFFGSQLHERNITEALNQLAAQKLIRSENQKISILTVLICIVTIGLICIAVISYVVSVRLKKVRIREAIVQEKYEHLDQTNKRLLEDGHIKEEYIGYFFHQISGNISRLEKLKRNTEHKLKTKNYGELIELAKEIDIKKERETLFFTFDTIFLKLFPNFIQGFNALLKPEDQIWPKSGEILNINLRIFALMRLGIRDNQTIANILESSLSTVYTYKNRIKGKALFHGEDFDNKIMAIKFVDVQDSLSESIYQN
jgi:DNA-binding CsgD family transcriptional regulator